MRATQVPSRLLRAQKGQYAHQRQQCPQWTETRACLQTQEITKQNPWVTFGDQSITQSEC